MPSHKNQLRDDLKIDFRKTDRGSIDIFIHKIIKLLPLMKVSQKSAFQTSILKLLKAVLSRAPGNYTSLLNNRVNKPTAILAILYFIFVAYQ